MTEVRDLRFDLAEVPRYWHGGRRAVTLLAVAFDLFRAVGGGWQWFSLLRYLLIEPGGMPGLLVPYLRYFRPGFHPWEHDTTDLLQVWKSGLAPRPARSE